MTIANQIKQTIEQNCPACFSLYAGYGMVGGEYVRWQGGVMLKERKNDRGRTTYALYQYADDSKLEYRYNTQTEQYSLSLV